MYVGIKQTRNNGRKKQELFGVLACPMCEIRESSNFPFIMVVSMNFLFLFVSITE